MSVTRDGLLKAVIANPEDWVLRSVYADCLEEEGVLVLAEGQRWQVANQKRPQRHNNGCQKSDWYLWGCADLILEIEKANNYINWYSRYIQAMIRKPLFEHIIPIISNILSTSKVGNTDTWAYYGSLQEAENALATALSKLQNGQSRS